MKLWPRVWFLVFLTHGVFTYICESQSFMACKFNCFVETEGLLKIIGSHVYHAKVTMSRKRCKRRDYRLLVGSDVAHRTAPFPSDIQDYSPF